MTARVAINGLGRIGGVTLKFVLENLASVADVESMQGVDGDVVEVVTQ